MFGVSDLDSGAGVEHDVFDGALNVLRPRHQPRDFIIMTNFLPPGAWRRFRVNRISEDNRQQGTVIFKTQVTVVQLADERFVLS